MAVTRGSIFRAAPLALGVALAAACGSDDGKVASGGSQVGSGGSKGGSGGSSGGSAAASGSSGSSGSSGVGGSIMLPPDAGDSGCQKVDFLFVVDNSVSMRDQQMALIGSFPGFINTIQNTLSANSDYHIMVVDTDAEGRCTPSNCMTGAMGADNLCINAAGGYACNTTFDACDNTLGAGVVHPAGDGASNQPCTIFGGNRYIIEGEPDLGGTFACMALVGLAGHPSERPMDALVAAMQPAINAPGGCNAGFLRHDAILVVTFISDDPNREDSGQPTEWHSAIVDAKNGDASSVVVLGLTPAFDGCGSASKPDKGKHWSDFVKLWGSQGLEASVCNLDYAQFFDQAVSLIDQTCDQFEPPK